MTNKIQKQYNRIAHVCDILESRMEKGFSKWRADLLKDMPGVK